MNTTKQPGNNNNNRSRIIAVLTGLFFLVSLTVGVISSQGSLYNITTIVIAIAGTAFTFFQLLPSISISLPRPSFPRVTIHKSSSSHYVLLTCSIIMLIVMLIQAVLRYTSTPPVVSDHCNTQVVKVNDASTLWNTTIQEAEDGECIGISDGGFSFDTNSLERPKGYSNVRKRVLTLMKSSHLNEAQALWRGAGAPNDAEMLIYLENERVAESHYPYINVVLATMLTGVEFNVGRDDTQGVYVAQKEINSSCKLPHCTQVRILIANSGSARNSGERAIYANNLAALIVQKADSYHIISTIGWPFSGQSVSAVQVLAPAHIPMISPSSSSESLTGTSYFWRVAPSDSAQAIVAVPFAFDVLQAHHVAVFYDPTDPYSRSLGEAFLRTAENSNHRNMIKELYTVGKTTNDSMIALLRDALKQAPDLDLIYFAGYADDASPLLEVLPPSASYNDLRVMGGDALYVTGSYRSGSYPLNSYGRLYLTTFSYPDEWDFLHLPSPRFFCEYTNDFSPQTACPGPEAHSRYHFSRASSDVILAYDAMMTFTQASSIVLAQSTKYIPDDIQQALGKVQGKYAVQGVSGRISLGSDGNPVNKAVVVLRVDEQGKEILESVQGCFLKDLCSNVTP